LRRWKVAGVGAAIARTMRAAMAGSFSAAWSSSPTMEPMPLKTATSKM
jgi:hypothetical protein